MDIRGATVDDPPAIRSTARRSFRASYALSPADMDLLLEDRFTTDALATRIEDSDTRLFVAEPGPDSATDAELAGFTELRADGTLQWLHVHPEERGRGVGTALVERLEDELGGDVTRLRAHLLGHASEGGSFLEQFGLEHSETESTTFGGEEFDVQVYAAGGGDVAPSEPEIDVPETVEVDGEEGSVHPTGEVSGTESPFFPVHASDAHETRLGVLCGQCGTTRVSADGLDRLECTECGNAHLSDTWDPAYL